MRRTLTFLAGLLSLAGAAVAEVSVDRTPNGVTGSHFEPSPKGPWSPVRSGIPHQDLLNPQGDWKGDGWPSIVTNRRDMPFVAFASAGLEAEVFFSRHDGMAWLPITNLSRQTGADQAPVAALDAWDNGFVAWSTTRPNRVSVSFAGIRRDGQATTGVVELSSRIHVNRVPSLAVHADGDVYVAYEERPAGPDDVPHLAVDRIRPVRMGDMSLHCSGENLPDFSRSVTRPTRLVERIVLAEPSVHSEQGHLWVTWIDSRMHVAWIELAGTGAFSDPEYVTLGPGMGVKEALEAIRETVLSQE